MKEISLPQAAVRLGLPWHAAHKLALRGVLGPVRQVAGRWLITEAGLESYLGNHQTSHSQADLVPGQ
jgi:hypothetical protein